MTWNYVYDLGTGIITSDVGIDLPSIWQSFDSDVLKYVLVHEVGHYLGLNHPPSCSDIDSPMSDVLNYPQQQCTAYTINTEPEFMDETMVNDGVYGTGSEAVCGF